MDSWHRLGSPHFSNKEKCLGEDQDQDFEQKSQPTAQRQQQAAGCYIKQRGAASNLLESLNRESATRERAVTAVYLQLGIFITDYEEIYL